MCMRFACGRECGQRVGGRGNTVLRAVWKWLWASCGWDRQQAMCCCKFPCFIVFREHIGDGEWPVPSAAQSRTKDGHIQPPLGAVPKSAKVTLAMRWSHDSCAVACSCTTAQVPEGPVGKNQLACMPRGGEGGEGGIEGGGGAAAGGGEEAGRLVLAIPRAAARCDADCQPVHWIYCVRSVVLERAHASGDDRTAVADSSIVPTE